MRVQVNLSDEMVEKIDNLAHEMGTSRSAFCAMAISATVWQYTKTETVLTDLLKQVATDPNFTV